MRVRPFIVVLVLACVASSIALTHMNNLPAFVVIGPGYVVQAWLFEHHLALGGFGYQATMITVSAVVWTLIIVGLMGAVRRVGRLLRGPN
jgi:di/tricarboxylate transporter